MNILNVKILINKYIRYFQSKSKVINKKVILLRHEICAKLGLANGVHHGKCPFKTKIMIYYIK